jgi:hypothetical protein
VLLANAHAIRAPFSLPPLRPNQVSFLPQCIVYPFSVIDHSIINVSLSRLDIKVARRGVANINGTCQAHKACGTPRRDGAGAAAAAPPARRSRVLLLRSRLRLCGLGGAVHGQDV